MKKTLLIILLLSMYFSILFAQTIKSKLAKKKIAKPNSTGYWEKNYKDEFSICGFTNKYTAQQRMSMYPFSKANKVLAVSYKYRGLNIKEKNEFDDFPKRGLSINEGILDTATLIEKKTLDRQQIDELTNLIFNTDYMRKWEFHVIEFGKCFEPRNALLFIDSENRIFDYLEICFECQQTYSKSDKFDIGILCKQKYELFSNYFKSVGIPYGTLGRNYREEDNKDWDELRK